ncbi:MAG: oligosaccharide flippase family protein [Geobacteraceae bacterium]|nr:oligosaccharide flippase family protein [Geobacteraceae bacterium]NTW79529.1 oligosaccharide flippase family protein [Geobacteraceae bacterium]
MSSLIARASVYLVSGLVAQGATFCLWLVLPWFLTPAEVGYVTLALFAVELLTMFSLAGMDAALIRFATRSDVRELTLVVALATTGTAFVIVAGLTYVVLKAGIPFLANTIIWVVAHYVLVLIAVAANVLWSLYQSYQVAARQAREYAIFQLVRAVVYLGLGIGGLVFFAQDASVVLMAAATASLGVLVLFTCRKNRPVLLGNPFHITGFGQMINYGLPLMLNSVLGVSASYTQRLVIDHYADISTLGLFGFFAAIAIQLNGFWASINRAWTPEFFSLMADDSARSIRLLQGMLVLVSTTYPLLLAVYVFFGEVFINELVLNATYVAHTDILYILLLAPLFCGLYTVAYPLYYYELKTHRIFMISLFLAVANLILSVVLIRAWGMVGAASSFVLLSILSAGTYLLCYRGWAEGGTRVVLMLIAITVLSMCAAGLLIATHSPWIFMVALLVISTVAWCMGGTLASPLLHQFLDKRKQIS